ncbi:MAG TPA: glycosyltransferase [Moorella mulderi]|nr:glycosyltransferase [Moorella mulderi]
MSEAWILGCRVHGLTLREAVERIAGFIEEGTPHQVVTLNAEMAYLAHRHPDLLRVINSASLVVPDGAGILWAARRLGFALPERLPGVDLALALMEKGSLRGWRFYFYGAAPGVTERAALKLKARFPRLEITGISHGYLSPLEEGDLLHRIRESRPHVLLVGLGSPKQEFWIARHLPELGVPVAMGVGGSFDVWSGDVSRAPVFLQRWGLEWLYRLFQQPRRLKRYVALPLFLAAVERERRWKKGRYLP